MADLETAADAALVKVKQLSEHAEKAEQALSGLSEQLSRVAVQLESDWAALSEDAKAFVQKLEAEKTRLQDEDEEAGKALTELRDALVGANTEGHEELQGARGEVSGFDAQVQAASPDLAGTMERIERTARALEQAAADVEEQLRQAVSEAREFVEVQIDALDLVEAQIRERAEDLQEDLVNDCQAALQDKYENWLTTLNEVEGIVEEAFGKAREHVEQVVEYSLVECARVHREALDELAQLAGGLAESLEALSRAIAEEAADVDRGKDALEGTFDDTDGRLQDMIAALQGMKELMASFSFVQI